MRRFRENDTTPSSVDSDGDDHLDVGLRSIIIINSPSETPERVGHYQLSILFVRSQTETLQTGFARLTRQRSKQPHRIPIRNYLTSFPPRFFFPTQFSTLARCRDSYRNKTPSLVGAAI